MPFSHRRFCPSRHSNLSTLSAACHPEQSEGSQPSTTVKMTAVWANPQRHREYRYCAEPGVPQQRSKSITRVLPEELHSYSFAST
jgi:hypothetical protein